MFSTYTKILMNKKYVNTLEKNKEKIMRLRKTMILWDECHAKHLIPYKT